MTRPSITFFSRQVSGQRITYRLHWWLASVPMIALAVALTLIVRRSDLLPGEAAVTRWLVDKTGRPGDVLGDFLDYISAETVAPFIFGAALLIVWRLWGRYPTWLLGLAGLLTAATKITDLADRPRPTPGLEWNFAYTGDGGFPSQHVIYAVLVFGLIAYFSLKYVRRPLWRWTMVGMFAGLAALMGPGRVIDGEHWPADVIGGYLISLPLLIALIWLHPRVLPVLRGRAPWLYRLAGAKREAAHAPPRPGCSLPTR